MVTETQLFSNLFWPLDGLTDAEYDGAVPGKQRDPEFGGEYGFNPNDEVTGDKPVINNSKLKHNWYFGMRYDFEFTIGDYVGPMDYYFRGDDDFWLYIDGNLVQEVELGGIHNARGAYVDMRSWMSKMGYLADDKLNDKHNMTVFFMERGGTGSCCYMSFTIPNAMPKPNPEVETTQVTVKKEWKDEGKESGRTPISVQLYRKNSSGILEECGSPVRLSESNDWEYSWENLPAKGMDGNAYIYQIKEISNIDGYITGEILEQKEGNTKIFTVTNVRKTDIPIEKKWKGDELKNRPKKIEVQLWKKYEDIPEGTNETQSNSDNPNQETSSTEENFIFPIENDVNWHLVDTQSLLPSAGWKYIWKDKPLYEKVDGRWMKVLYTIKELDGDYLKPGWTPESSDGSDGWYTDTYTGNATDGFTITNTFVKSFSGEIPISKECVDFEGTETFKFNIKEGTFTEANGWHPVSDSSMLETEITVNDNTVTVYLKRIREKLQSDIIITIKGIGYRIDENKE